MKFTFMVFGAVLLGLCAGQAVADVMCHVVAEYREETGWLTCDDLSSGPNKVTLRNAYNECGGGPKSCVNDANNPVATVKYTYGCSATSTPDYQLENIEVLSTSNAADECTPP